MELDAAHAAMDAGGEAEALAFWRAFADAELFLVLEEEPLGAQIRPRVFELSSGPLLLVFDSEERLATLSADPVPYAALPGRVIAGQLEGQGLGLGLNLGSGAPSETLLPPASVDWLAGVLAQAAPEETSARIRSMGRAQVPGALRGALAALLPPGSLAALAMVEYDGGARGHVLALAGIDAARQEGFARAVTEVLAFSGLDAASLDLLYLEADAPMLRALAQAGEGFAGPEVKPVAPAKQASAPGMDPAKPPKLR